MAKNTSVAKAPSEEVLAALANSFPVDEGFQSTPMPRISFVSQDITEETGVGRNKQIKVIVPAGTFFREVQSEETDADGKPVWEKEELGDEIDLHIVYQRKQLKHYEAATNSFASSNIYDDDGEEVILFQNKTEIARGLPADLKQDYMTKDDRSGKEKSSLEDNRVLYALLEVDGKWVLHQLNTRGTSMYAWMNYARATRPSVPAVITTVSSEPRENGSTKWNCMKFVAARTATAEETERAQEQMAELIQAINDRKERAQAKKDSDEEFNNFGKPEAPASRRLPSGK